MKQTKLQMQKILHEWVIYEKDLPWWFFWIHPSDNLIFQHYGFVLIGRTR